MRSARADGSLDGSGKNHRREQLETLTQSESDVSVVIPAYNCADQIHTAIDSIDRQTLRPAEIVIVDDGSLDSTADVLRDLAKSRPDVRVATQVNAGPAAARNKGIKIATSHWIAFLDADDRWLPHRLESQLACSRERPELNWFAGGFYQVRAGEPLRENSLTETIRSEPGDDLAQVIDPLEALAGLATLWTGTILVRRDSIVKVGGFNAKLKVAEDSELWLRLALENRQIGFVREPIAVYTTAQETSLVGQASRQVNDSQIRHYEMIRKHGDSAGDDGIRDAIDRIITSKVNGYARSLIRTGHTSRARQFCRQLKEANFPLPNYATRLAMQVPGFFIRGVREARRHLTRSATDFHE